MPGLLILLLIKTFRMSGWRRDRRFSTRQAHGNTTTMDKTATLTECIWYNCQHFRSTMLTITLYCKQLFDNAVHLLNYAFHCFSDSSGL